MRRIKRKQLSLTFTDFRLTAPTDTLNATFPSPELVLQPTCPCTAFAAHNTTSWPPLQPCLVTLESLLNYSVLSRTVLSEEHQRCCATRRPFELK